jgi:TonB family protein
MRVKSAHTEDTKLARSPLCLLRALCVMLLLLACSAVAQEATQKPKIICDHAAPPAGMHYVCKSQCDCHLEGKLKNDEDGPPPASAPTDTCQPLMTSIFVPPYPQIARMNRIAGTVFVQVEIDPEGNVTGASIQQGHPLFTGVVLKAAKRWRFSAGCSKVQTVSVRFELSDDQDRNPGGFKFSPPDDISVVAEAPVVQTTETAIAKKKAKKKPVPKSK